MGEPLADARLKEDQGGHWPVFRKDFVRMIMTSGPGNNAVVNENPDKVFCVIGPFENFGDKIELERALEIVCRGFNLDYTSSE